MKELKEIILTKIYNPARVFSEKGRKLKIESRVFYGISLCKSGQITYSMNGKKFVSEPACAIFHPKGATYLLEGDKEGLFPVINFDAEGIDYDEIKVIPLQEPDRCIALFEAMERAENRLMRMSLFYQLLNELSSNAAKGEGMLAPALSYIDEHLSSDLSNEDLARILKISEGYLRKLFLKELQITPKQYILKRRIKRAKQLLINTPWTVTAIAEECGFSSVYHFCRAFRGHTGLTPTQYAKTNRIFEI